MTFTTRLSFVKMLSKIIWKSVILHKIQLSLKSCYKFILLTITSNFSSSTSCQIISNFWMIFNPPNPDVNMSLPKFFHTFISISVEFLAGLNCTIFGFSEATAPSSCVTLLLTDSRALVNPDTISCIGNQVRLLNYVGFINTLSKRLLV